MSSQDAVTPRVVLVNPPAPFVREETYDRPAYPTIGIAYVAGYMEEHGGITPLVVDGKLERLSVEETIDAIAAYNPDIVGLTAFTHLVTTAARIGRELKARLPHVTVVLGGYHASFLPERTLEEFPIFDYLVVGEGEIAFLELSQAIARGERRPTIQGVWYRDGDRVIAGGRGRIPEKLDDLGMPGWHLFNAEAMRKHAKMLPVMSQRGCPFECNFCSRPYGRTLRRRTPARVVDEIQRNIERFGIRTTAFYDETFTVVSHHVNDICDEILKRRLPSNWSATVHANTIDTKLIRNMKRAGCTTVGFGVESGDDDIIAAMKKGVTKARILAAARACREEGLEFASYFIIGHPNETVAAVFKSIRFAAQLNANYPAFGVLVPYPGTEVWELAVKGEGGYRKLSDNWDDYNKQIGNAVELVNLSRRWMEVLQIFGYLYVYAYNLRLRDALKIFWSQKIRIISTVKNVLFKPLRSTLSASARRRIAAAPALQTSIKA